MERAKGGDVRKENRYRRVLIGQDTMLDLLSRIRGLDNRPEPKYWLTSNFPQLPADAQLDAVHYDHFCRGFSLLISSSEFSPVPFGQEIPRLETDGPVQSLRVEAAYPLANLALRIEAIGLQPGEVLALYYPVGQPPECLDAIRNCIESMELPDTFKVVLLPDCYSLAKTTEAALPVSLPPVVKTWEGQNSKDAPEAKPEDPKEAAARRLKELAAKIAEKKRAPRSEWRQAVADLRHFIKINEQPSGHVSSFDHNLMQACPVSCDMCRHILFYPGERDVPDYGAIGQLYGNGDYYAPEPEQYNAEIARQLVEEAAKTSPSNWTGGGNPVADVLAMNSHVMQAVGAVDVGEPVYGPSRFRDLYNSFGLPAPESLEMAKRIREDCPITEPDRPIKSEARLALEYDLRQRLHPAEGSPLDQMIGSKQIIALQEATDLNSDDSARDRLMRPGDE